MFLLSQSFYCLCFQKWEWYLCSTSFHLTSCRCFGGLGHGEPITCSVWISSKDAADWCPQQFRLNGNNLTNPTASPWVCRVPSSFSYLPSPSSQRCRFHWEVFLFCFLSFLELKWLKYLLSKRLLCTPGNSAEGKRILLLLNLNIWIHNMVMAASGWEGKTCVLLSGLHFLKFLVYRPQLQCENKIFPLFPVCHFPFVPSCTAPYSTLMVCP